MDPYTKANLANWNERTGIHARSAYYDVQGFKAGKSTLRSLELEEVGDVDGKALLHLQCHFGLDTLSWARQGAQVTGVDFSSKAVELAQALADETQLEARFICSEIYTLREVLVDQFDIVFASYGVLCWISDIRKWVKTASSYLTPGGFLYLVDGHPLADIFDSSFQIEYPYFHRDEPFPDEGAPDYADRDALITTPNFQWSHSLGDVVNASIEAGLRLEFMREFPFCGWERFPGLMRLEKGSYVMKDPKIQIPLQFSVKATKK
jgi:SAM-dependent methyltransferase